MQIKNNPQQSFGMRIKNTEGLQTILKYWEHKGNLGKKAIGQLGKIKKLMNDSFELEIKDIARGASGQKPVSYVIRYKDDNIIFHGNSSNITPYHFIKDLKALVRHVKEEITELKGSWAVANRR